MDISDTLAPKSDQLEEWRRIPGYEGRYDVSNLGRVRSLDRVRANGRKWRGRILKPVPMARGYLSVNLWLDNTPRMHLIHRLVLAAFVGPVPEGAEGRHSDGNSSNNQLVNLEWGTHSENQYDQVAHGTHHHAALTHCPAGHPYDDENTYVYPGRPHRACRTCRRENGRKWREANPDRAQELNRAANRRYQNKRKAA